MNYTREITLDISARNDCGVVVDARQGDDGTRFVKINLVRDGVPYAPPSGTTARFRALKPDGCSVDNPATISGGTVTVELTEQTLAVPGWVDADVVLTDAQSNVLSTAPFKIHVGAAPVGKNITSTNEFLTLQALIRKAEGLEDSSASGESDVSGVPADIVAEAERVASGMISKMGGNSLTFVAVSDTHELAAEDSSDSATQECTRRGNKNAGQGAKIIADKLALDFFCHLGDLAFGSSETTIHGGVGAMARVREYFAPVTLNHENFYTPGNHDGLHYSYSANGEYLSYDALAEYIGTYRYVDFPGKKVRVICLNTADNSVTESASQYISGKQLQWFCQALDLSGKSDAANWGIVLLSHHPLDWADVSVAADVIAAYEAGRSYSAVRDGVTVSYNFSGKNTAQIIASFHGHVHGFRVDTITGTKVKRVAIPNSYFYRNNEYGQNSGADSNGIEFGETTTYNKVDNSTGKNTAFCLISIDLDKKVIYADCFGAGYDRVISYGEEEIVTYTVTNNLSNATTSNGSASAVEGDAYSAAIIPNDGYDLVSVTVTMGGTNITSSVYSNGNIHIPSVTGNIVITVTTTANAVIYTVTSNLTRVTNSNSAATVTEGGSYTATLTAKAGYRLDSVTVTMGGQAVSVTNGVISISKVTGNIVITATAASIYNVTNLVPTSQEAGSTAAYNGVGYQDGVYCSSSGGDSTDSACVSTGYIPYEWVTGNVIYIRGAAVTSASHVRVYGYAEKGSAPHSSTTASGPTLSTYFTVEELESGTYYKLTPTGAKVTSYIRFSLIGTGEDLIITVNEPIVAA